MACDRSHARPDPSEAEGYPRPAWSPTAGRATSCWPTAAPCTCGRSGRTTPSASSPSTPGFSPESVYFRFFSPKPAPDRQGGREVHHRRHGRPRRARRRSSHDDIIAVARYDRWPGRDEAEVAFTVADEHHGRGLATLLLEHLAAIAPTKGINRFTAEVLPDNRTMLGVFRRGRLRGPQRVLGRASSTSASTSTRPRTTSSRSTGASSAAESRSIARLLRPRSVAVIGASDRKGSVGREIFRNLLNVGFDGPVYPVNPTTPHVASVPPTRRCSTSPTTSTWRWSPCRPRRCRASSPSAPRSGCGGDRRQHRVQPRPVPRASGASARSSSSPVATACASSGRRAWASIDTDPTAPHARQLRPARRARRSRRRVAPVRPARHGHDRAGRPARGRV